MIFLGENITALACFASMRSDTPEYNYMIVAMTSYEIVSNLTSLGMNL